MITYKDNSMKVENDSILYSEICIRAQFKNTI